MRAASRGEMWSGTIATIDGLGGNERFGRLGPGSNGVAPGIFVSAILEILFGAFEKLLRFVQLLRHETFGTGIARRFDRLTRIAHLLHGRARAAGKARDQQEKYRERATQDGGNHGSRAVLFLSDPTP
jgi:hypothetical protein